MRELAALRQTLQDQTAQKAQADETVAKVRSQNEIYQKESEQLRVKLTAQEKGPTTASPQNSPGANEESKGGIGEK